MPSSKIAGRSCSSRTYCRDRRRPDHRRYKAKLGRVLLAGRSSGAETRGARPRPARRPGCRRGGGRITFIGLDADVAPWFQLRRAAGTRSPARPTSVCEDIVTRKRRHVGLRFQVWSHNGSPAWQPTARRAWRLAASRSPACPSTAFDIRTAMETSGNCRRLSTVWTSVGRLQPEYLTASRCQDRSFVLLSIDE